MKNAIDWDKGNGLVPAVVQDFNTQQVLMLGYMNKEALSETIKTKRVTFYSRSKGRLWVKGETSKNYLNFDRYCMDCDNDAILIFATPEGPTCHLNRQSCFSDGSDYSSYGFLRNLENIISVRSKSEDDNSYTARLFKEGIIRVAQKIGEEGVEVALAAAAGSNDELVQESADLIYHLLVLLQMKNMSFEEVVRVLQDRNKA